jgi:hypothetical protein
MSSARLRVRIVKVAGQGFLVHQPPASRGQVLGECNQRVQLLHQWDGALKQTAMMLRVSGLSN